MTSTTPSTTPSATPSSNPASRAAVACASALAAVHLLGAVHATGDTGERAAGLLLCAVLLATSVGIARGNRFGARLAAVVVCLLDLVTMVLVVTVGPPGEGRDPFDLTHAVVGTLAAATVALVIVGGRRPADQSGVDNAPPYAL